MSNLNNIQVTLLNAVQVSETELKAAELAETVELSVDELYDLLQSLTDGGSQHSRKELKATAKKHKYRLCVLAIQDAVNSKTQHIWLVSADAIKFGGMSDTPPPPQSVLGTLSTAPATGAPQ